MLRDLAVLEVLYGAGLRVAECCGLRIADCDLDRGLVTVVGKGSKVRRVPIGAPAVDAVARLARLRSARARRTRRRRRMPSSSTGADTSSLRATPAACSSGTRCPTVEPSTRMRSATRTLRTCSKAVPTSERSRSSSATQISRRPRSTPT